MFEKMVPKSRNISRGSKEHMSFVDNFTQTVVMMNSAVNGMSGLNASKIGRIFPVLFLYDLHQNEHFRMVTVCKRSSFTYLYTLYMINGWLLTIPDTYSSHSNAVAGATPNNGSCQIFVPNRNVANSVSVTP